MGKKFVKDVKAIVLENLGLTSDPEEDAEIIAEAVLAYLKPVICPECGDRTPVSKQSYKYHACLDCVAKEQLKRELEHTGEGDG